jgi:hypothetical protein
MSATCRYRFRHDRATHSGIYGDRGDASTSLDDRIRQLVTETCHHPRGSLKHRQNFNRLVQAIIQSGKLWWEDTPYYNDALQQTWLYLCRNLCQSTTGGKYDPTQSQVTTWLNQYLKRRLQDFYIEARQWQKQHTDLPPTQEGQPLNPIEVLPAPPDVPPILEDTRQWAQTDADGELRRIHVKGRPDITCQVLILRRLPPETDWKTLETEFGCSYSTLANFYQRQCLPSLRKFGQSQGYLQ